MIEHILVLHRLTVDFGPDQVKPKIMKLVFVASPLTPALRRKNKDWLARNQDNVSEWGDMSIHGLLLR
jgi:hypothetical protein